MRHGNRRAAEGAMFRVRRQSGGPRIANAGKRLLLRVHPPVSSAAGTALALRQSASLRNPGRIYIVAMYNSCHLQNVIGFSKEKKEVV